MGRIEMAPYVPYDQGPAHLHIPTVYGASPNKPMLWAIPATGVRPLRYAALGIQTILPQGTIAMPLRGMGRAILVPGVALRSTPASCFAAPRQLKRRVRQETTPPGGANPAGRAS